MSETSLNQTNDYRETAFKVRLRRFYALLARLCSNPTTVIGLIIIGLMLAMAIFAPWITQANVPDPYQMPRDWSAVRKPPGTQGFLLGTTNEGGDVFYGVVWGSRTSLQLSLYVVGSTMVIGTIIGSLAGLLGGWVDEFLMRLVDVFLSIPELIFALAIAAVLGPSFTNIIIALSMVIWVKYARIMRAQVLQIKQNEYVDAAKIVGDSKLNIYLKDILPNAVTPVTVQATLDMGNVVLIGATLSFIGLSEAGIAEWGVLVSEGQAGIASGRWWASTFPGMMIFLWALAFNLVGDGLRDALDPRTEGR
ncbi:MAG: D-ala-D-ala transporter subunit [Rhodobacteraceae bacterium TMED111]|nr:D-ala-D-ala transporter subunit [Marinovum sp.]OUV42994.1 MAG: D-ala-D-ala transporter subunit [Rhodobacteraceae bacterium TMED111]|tara:strand:+ start:3487 stop:4407 length:921 start_codon:yes stop_codon:yes gene_type:complete